MQCPQCQTELPENARFCPYCGPLVASPDPAAFVAAVRQGCLLAQFTAEKLPGMDWGGGGLIDYWIRTADLAAARFDRVHAQRVTT
jgi:hypothetical protein